MDASRLFVLILLFIYIKKLFTFAYQMVLITCKSFVTHLSEANYKFNIKQLISLDRYFCLVHQTNYF